MSWRCQIRGGDGVQSTRGSAWSATYPRVEHDQLFETDYDHPVGKASCADCHIDRVVRRTDREDQSPTAHYGLITSGNQVMRDDRTRELVGLQMVIDFICKILIEIRRDYKLSSNV